MINILPNEIRRKWLAELHQAAPGSAYRLVATRPTDPNGYEAQRIIVLVTDENGFPMPNVPVAFSYSTAEFYDIGSDFTWMPPTPRRAHVVPTQGSGQIEQIQGDVVKAGYPGGVTVYVLDPRYPSDVVTGCGMLADHTGLHLTFRLEREGVRPLIGWVTELEERMGRAENKLGILEELIRERPEEPQPMPPTPPGSEDER